MTEQSSIEKAEEVIKKRDRLSAENIRKSDYQLKSSVKDKIYPIILGCYDEGVAEKELEILRNNVRKEYPNALLLKEIPDIVQIHWNKKFKHHVDNLRRSGGFVFPIIYLHPVMNEGKGLGLINEIRDIIDIFHHVLILKTLILTNENLKSFEHVKYFPNINEVQNLDDASQKVLSHLNKHLSWIENRILIKQIQAIDLNISESPNNEKGDTIYG